MAQRISQLALLVRAYDEAIDFYTRVLGFELLEDTPLSDTKRWVRVAPRGSGGESGLLLAQATTLDQLATIGKQAGGRVFLFLETDDFDADYANLLRHKVTIVRERSEEAYGTVAVFEDLYGNQWDLIQRPVGHSKAATVNGGQAD